MSNSWLEQGRLLPVLLAVTEKEIKWAHKPRKTAIFSWFKGYLIWQILSKMMFAFKVDLVKVDLDIFDILDKLNLKPQGKQQYGSPCCEVG